MVVALIGVVVCLMVYMLVFDKYNEQTAALKTSNAQLKIDVEDMKQYYDNIPVYRADINQMMASISEFTEDYPGDAKEEDVVMMAVAMNSVAVINFDKINVEEPKIIHTVPVETVTGAAVEGMEEAVDFVVRQASYSNTTTYSNLKSAVAEVYKSPYRIGINSLSYKKDNAANNYIQGTIDISYYSLRGMGKSYEDPNMPTYFGGATDLFGILYWSLAEDSIVNAAE